MSVQIPASFRAMPRWANGGTAWLDALPDLADDWCRRARLTVDGAAWHGSNALVVPVRRDGVELALRLTPADDPVADQVAALHFWDGRGTVRLVEADAAAGMMLLERLDAMNDLAALPLAEAVPTIARVMRRLAAPVPDGLDVPDTGDIVVARRAELPLQWRRLGAPFDGRILRAAFRASAALEASVGRLAVDGDLHYQQVLSGEREPWLVVDPVLMRGDTEYDLARLLWSRLDEMRDTDEIRHWLDVIVAEADLDADRALAWALFRTVDYWLWGLAHGLTEDPARCERLVEALLG